jgi:hypothetical protein
MRAAQSSSSAIWNMDHGMLRRLKLGRSDRRIGFAFDPRFALRPNPSGRDRTTHDASECPIDETTRTTGCGDNEHKAQWNEQPLRSERLFREYRAVRGMHIDAPATRTGSRGAVPLFPLVGCLCHPHSLSHHEHKISDGTPCRRFYSEYMAGVDRNNPRKAASSDSRYSLMEFMREFPDDATALEHLWRARYSPDGEHAHCPSPSCKRERTFKRYATTQRRQSWTCTACGTHIHPTAGTIFHKSSTSLHLWFYAMFRPPS